MLSSDPVIYEPTMVMDIHWWNESSRELRPDSLRIYPREQERDDVYTYVDAILLGKFSATLDQRTNTILSLQICGLPLRVPLSRR